MITYAGKYTLFVFKFKSSNTKFDVQQNPHDLVDSGRGSFYCPNSVFCVSWFVIKF